MSNKSLERKERSIKILKEEKVPYIDHLPLIESEDEVEIRSVEEICNRAICLSIVAGKAEGVTDDIFQKMVERYEVEDDFTPAENEFIKNYKEDDQGSSQMLWRYESLWVLLWVLGYIDEIGRPDKTSDVEKSVTTILTKQNKEEFVNESKMRSETEILDLLDLTYRYHWATTDALNEEKPAPSELDDDVLYERHYALNWVTKYFDLDWDDISTDT